MSEGGESRVVTEGENECMFLRLWTRNWHDHEIGWAYSGLFLISINGRYKDFIGLFFLGKLEIGF